MNTQARPAAPWNWRNASDNDPLYVYNKSGESGDREAGKVVIPVMIDGDQRTVTLENTHIVQDLSLQALPSQIVRTMEFRRLVNMGIIEVVDPETGDSMMQNPAVKAEQKRLQDSSRQKKSGPGHVDAGAMMGGQQGGRSNVTGAVDAGHIVASRQAEQSGMAQTIHHVPDRDDNPNAAQRRPFVPGAHAVAGLPTAEGMRSNIGLEVLDRLNKGEIDMGQALKAMEAAAIVMNDDEKLRLKQLQNLPVELREVVALM